MFNAASIFVCEAERLAPELRLRTLIELVNNKLHYMIQNPMFSNTADYDEAIIDCSREGGYSCVWILYAFATVLKRDIILLYPAVNGGDNVAVTILNRRLSPQTADNLELQPMQILWTRSHAPSQLIPECFWTPNHFVPVINYVNTALPRTASVDTVVPNPENDRSSPDVEMTQTAPNNPPIAQNDEDMQTSELIDEERTAAVEYILS